MKTRTWTLPCAAIVALVATTTLTSVASKASVPSSPAERAATAELNRAVTLKNAAADERSRVLEAQYQEQMRQYEAQRLEYQAPLQSAQDKRDR